MSTPESPQDWRERFDEMFPMTYLWTSPTGNGGFDTKPYIKEFIAKEIDGAEKERVQYILETYKGMKGNKDFDFELWLETLASLPTNHKDTIV